MVSKGDNWIRIFDIPEISKHRKGFTIYKVVSMLYPETCPDTITKITVWKRFNDFKKLYREIKVLHNKLNIKDKYPSLPSSSFFKRFDDETVQTRKQSILNFLEYVAYHSQLFTSNEFVKFFEISHTPSDHLNSNINSIRADLNLPEDPEYFIANSDDDHTISDTDSIATSTDFMGDTVSHHSRHLSKSKLSLNTSMTNSHYSRNSDSISVSTTTDSITLLDGQIYPTPPNTPQCTDCPQYIIDASIHINIAIELEHDKKYEEAFTAYKTAIDILLKYGKDDKDYDRRQMIRYKTDKYLIRAEKIYNMHLASEVQTLKEITKKEENKQNDEHFIQRPISELYKYKVVKVVASGMLVLHVELQQLFFIKVIHKTMKFLNENLILPEHVPYMVKLHNYYNCENALFLVLEYCSGKKLWDYIKYSSENPDEVFHYNDDLILRQVHDMELSDPESEHSYSDLINDYANNKSKNVQSTKQDVENDLASSDGSYEKVNLGDLISSDRNLMDEPVPSQLQLTDLLTKSLPNSDNPTNSRRTFSEMSSIDEIDVTQNFFVPLEKIVKWSAQLLLALEKLHTLGVTCYDLQSKNLLIDEHEDLILTYMCNINEISDLFCNRNSFNIAPELYTFETPTNAVDWWCFGAILYELLVGMPLSFIHPDGLNNCTNLKIPKYVTPEGRSLLRQLLTTDPKQRIGYGVNGTESLKSHPFFHSVCWEKLLGKYNY